MNHNGQPPPLFPGSSARSLYLISVFGLICSVPETGNALTWLAVIFGKESVLKVKIAYAALSVFEVWDYTPSYGFALPISEWAIL